MSTLPDPDAWFLEGNWDPANPGNLGGWISTFAPAGMPLFELTPITGEPDEIVANARKIVCADEMLKALKAIIGEPLGGEATGATGTFPLYVSWDAVRAARAIISKAEGRA